MRKIILLLILSVGTIQIAYGGGIGSIVQYEWMNNLFYDMFCFSPLCYRFSDCPERNLVISFMSSDELVVENMPDKRRRHLKFIDNYKIHQDNSNKCNQTKRIVIDQLVVSSRNQDSSVSCQLSPYSSESPKSCGEVLHILDGDTIVLSQDLRFLSIGNMIFDSSDKEYGIWTENKKLREIVSKEQIVGRLRRGLSNIHYVYELEDYLFLIRIIMALYK